jgi:hypothetical protein
MKTEEKIKNKLIEEIIVTDVCKKKNCFRDHTEDGRHKIRIIVEENWRVKSDKK